MPNNHNVNDNEIINKEESAMSNNHNVNGNEIINKEDLAMSSNHNASDNEINNKEDTAMSMSSNHNVSDNNIKREVSLMSSKSINTMLPDNIRKTTSIFPDMRIPSSISVYADEVTGLDILRNEDGVELITCVKDNEYLVVSTYDPDAPSAISAIFGKDDVSSESHLHFELDKTQQLLERGDATVLFYLTEITNRYGYSSNEILKVFDCLTEIDIDQETLFRALERSSTDEELEEIFSLIATGDALMIKEFINDLNDVPTYNNRNYLDSTYDKDNNDDMDDNSDDGYYDDGYYDDSDFDGDSYEDNNDDY